MNNAQHQEQTSELCYEAPGELLAQAYAEAKYDFEGKF
jgi:hypothetical protein